MKRHSEERVHGHARYEYAFMLRCEGMLYRDIGKSLGVSTSRAQVMVQKFRRLLRASIRGCKFRFVREG
jgi:transposase